MALRNYAAEAQRRLAMQRGSAYTNGVGLRDEFLRCLIANARL